ncbi:tetratricopeptide repeat protein [Endothiovibrio diazotrophicus]
MKSSPLLFALLLAGCSTAPVSSTAENPAPEPAAPAASAAPEGEAPAAAELTPELVYGVLLGEIAGQRHEFGVATAAYLRAAEISDSPRVARRAARIALFSHDPAAALKAVRRWVALAPDDAEAHQSLGVLLARGGEVEAAVAAFERYIELVGDREKALRAMLHALAGEEDRAQALPVFGALAGRHPDDPDVALAYARMALEAGQYESALEQAENALRLRSDWRDARLLRARILIALERPEPALADMRAAIADQPDDHLTRMAYARMLVQLRHLDEAAAQFEEALRIEPKDDDALFALALLALDQERLEPARGYLERLIALGKRLDEAHYYLGVIAEREERPEEAVTHYGAVEGGEYGLSALVRRVHLLAGLGRMAEARAELAQLRGANPQLSIQLYQLEGELLREAGDYPAALAIYDEAVARHPGDDDLLYSRALAAEKAGRIDVLERDLRSILERKPDHAQALNALGYTLADRTDRHAEALKLIDRALELDPDDPAVLDSAGWVRYRLGRLEEARGFLQRAFDKAHDPEIAAHLGEVLWVMGRRDEARAVWAEAKAKAADPDHPVLRETMERLIR